MIRIIMKLVKYFFNLWNDTLTEHDSLTEHVGDWVQICVQVFTKFNLILQFSFSCSEIRFI